MLKERKDGEVRWTQEERRGEGESDEQEENGSCKLDPESGTVGGLELVVGVRGESLSN